MKLICVIENVSNRYGGPASSLPGMLLALKKHYEIEIILVSVNCNGSKEYNDNLKGGEILWDNSSRLFGPRKIMYSPGLYSKLLTFITGDSVVYINNLWNYVSYCSFRAARKRGAKIIISPRGSLYPWSLSQRKWIKKLAWLLFQRQHLCNADAIHVTCEDELEAVKNIGVNARISVIPHGVEPLGKVTKYAGTSYQKLSISPFYKYFLFMSRLHKKKGLDELLRIWKEKSHDYPQWKLIIAGPDYGNYSESIRDLSESVIYVGELYGDDKKDLFSVSEFFVLPSHTENFGIVIAESLSAGVPVITTTNTPWEVVNENDCGACVPLEDFSNTVVDFLEKNPSELLAMGERGKNLIFSKYSWDIRAKQFKGLLDGVKNA